MGSDEQQAPTGGNRPLKIPLWRKALYALVAVVMVLGVAEGTLHVIGFEGTTMAELEATAGFNRGAYVQRRDRILGDWYLEEVGPNGGQWMVSNRQLQHRGFHQERFPREATGELRLFAIGGSTTYGIPYEHQERGFPQRLQGVLEKRHPGRRWRLINAGVAGMDSRAFPQMMREITRLDPHGLVIYSGNNELRGALIEACADPYREGLERWLNKVRLVRLARSTYRQVQASEQLSIDQMAMHQDKCMTYEVDRQLETVRAGDGVASKGSDEPWFPASPARTDRFYVEAVRVFADNIQRVLAMARSAGIKVYLVYPAVNYLHPPNLARARADLGPQDIQQLDQLVRSGEGFLDKGRTAEASRDLSAALALDPGHADANYLAGKLDLEAGRQASARKRLQLAVDNDYFGDRITSHMEGALRQLCKANEEVTCVDVKTAFNKASPEGVPRKDLLVDFCHPTYEKGVQLIADTLAKAVILKDLAR